MCGWKHTLRRRTQKATIRPKKTIATARAKETVRLFKTISSFRKDEEMEESQSYIEGGPVPTPSLLVYRIKLDLGNFKSDFLGDLSNLNKLVCNRLE